MDLIKEDYLKVKKAMIQGARTIEEVKEKSDLVIDTPEMEAGVQKALASACGCKQVSLEEVVKAVQNGAKTVEEVGEITTAGTGCGNCQALIKNVIELGR